MLGKKLFGLFSSIKVIKRTNTYLNHNIFKKKFPYINKSKYCTSHINNNQTISPQHRYSNPYYSNGEIQLIYGPMFSGKTSELIRRIRRYTSAKRRCIIIKYSRDIRYDDVKISTHDRQFNDAISSDENLFKIWDKVQNYDVIGIDEGQFFNDVVDFSENLANNGKCVIVAALDGTFQRKPFGSVLSLIPLAEQVTKLSAVCVICQNDAAFSLRTTEETQVEVIGGADKYIAVCRRCYHDHSNKHK